MRMMQNIGGQLVGFMPVLAACHLIYVFSVVLHCISIYVVANKVLSLSLTLSLPLPLSTAIYNKKLIRR